MPLSLFAHPFSSYSQKVLVALYELRIPFDFRLLTPDDPQTAAEHASLWPLRRMPVLVDGERTVAESTIIIEHLDLHYSGPLRLVPEDPGTALGVRMMDRFFDNYVMAPTQAIVGNALRQEGDRDPYGVERARQQLDRAYAWLDESMDGAEWAAGKEFSLADCAAAPSLFYADWTHPISEEFANVRTYRQRLLVRPSFARAVEEARPYRQLFPLGAPDRD